MPDEKNKMEQQSPGSRQVRKEPNRSPKAALVWLIIMLVIGGLFLFKGFGSSQTRDITQSQFETLLKSNLISTAVLVSEGDKVFTVEGVLKSAPDAAAALLFRWRYGSGRRFDLLQHTSCM